MNSTIKKAVFPVAGLGTRFLPVTKANPKEMLPIVDKPLIQYAVEEAVAAGIQDLVFVTGRGKRAIEDHFDKTYELEVTLEARGRHRMLTSMRGILPEEVSCIYIRQPEPLGLGDAVLRARSIIGNEPFAVILADDLIDAAPGCIAQMIDVHERHGASVLAVESIPPTDTDKYGVIESGDFANGIARIDAIVEKPSPASAPSNLGVVGRYILTPGIFDQLADLGRDDNGEIQLTDGIARLLAHERVLALEFTGQRYDCGDKLGFLKATVEYAIKHPELKDEFLDYLAKWHTRR
ncbi:MAG: UTP--glucose-1-phosphate uridylyltransferase GalU [Gammaproteobacteria bacterium]|nr:UTP--glucose-1-phosphate uridylyltransferase GalU [Gammaproteobacteria bacterium]NNJ85347.1 UTP--glucose-1-phosphate uridylyltransferase GalU [Gammaproteobacteria bacterium]